MYYFAHFHSLISYGLISWGSSSEISRVLILQKRATRHIYGLGVRDSCRPLFRGHRVMTVVCIYIYQLLLHVKQHGDDYKSLRGSYNTRDSLLLEYPVHRTATFESSPHYMSIRCFNKLSKDIRALNTKAFKTRMKDLLIDKAYYTVSEFFNDSLP